MEYEVLYAFAVVGHHCHLDLRRGFLLTCGSTLDSTRPCARTEFAFTHSSGWVGEVRNGSLSLIPKLRESSHRQSLPPLKGPLHPT